MTCLLPLPKPISFIGNPNRGMSAIVAKMLLLLLLFLSHVDHPKNPQEHRRVEGVMYLGKLGHQGIQLVELNGGLPGIGTNTPPGRSAALVLVQVRQKLV